METNTQTWLVAYDFSDLAKAALAKAREQLAALGGGRIVVAHVHPPATDGVGIDLGSLGSGFAQAEQEIVGATDRVLKDQVAALPPTAGLSYEYRLMVGRPADSIVHIAKDVGATQIVVGSHGRRGFERLLLGSVAERVLRLSEVPVLIVKG